jgi:hypothetical protein
MEHVTWNKMLSSVIPAEAGIQSAQILKTKFKTNAFRLDSCLRRNDNAKCKDDNADTEPTN